MIIDNAGFDVAAMAKLTVDEFINIHLSNDAICRNKTEAEKRKWLSNAHASIVAVSKASAKTGGISTDKPGKKD